MKLEQTGATGITNGESLTQNGQNDILPGTPWISQYPPFPLTDFVSTFHCLEGLMFLNTVRLHTNEINSGMRSV